MQVVTLSDKDMLKYTSTSPLVEGPDFCKDMRSCLALLIDKPNSSEMFPGGSTLAFRWQDAMGWVKSSNPPQDS